jgi:hypothetical protein
MSRGKWVALAGGLGNQLFQYAYSVSNLEMRNESTLECVGFLIGEGKTFSPEIGKFCLPHAKVSSNHWSNSHLEQRSFNYLLRASAYKKPRRRLKIISLFARTVVTPRVIYMYLKKTKNARFTPFNLIPHLEIGYFQNSEISKDVISKMMALSLRVKSNVVDEHIALAKVEKPLFLHIRRGDYRQNPDLGCLSETYYRTALQEVWHTGVFNKIWLFSDDSESSIDVLDRSLHPFVRVIDSKISTAETFEILRLGAGYIIANSSFSFWAATLRRNQDSNVYAPSPWFKKTLFQDKNFPSDWNLIPADFDSY